LEEEIGLVYFPKELVPVARHPIISNLGDSAVREVLIHHLYTHLDFTANLEHEIVNEIAKDIAHRKIGLTFPSEMVLDAYKLYCDEAYHALFSEDLKLQVNSATRISPNSVDSPQFLRRLRSIQSSLPSEYTKLIELFFVIVSETLISSTLSKIPKDKKVISAVRELIGDHAEDEGRHHAYFASVLKIVWPQLTPKQKATIGPLIPIFILSFLEPDYAAIVRCLSNFKLTEEEIGLLLHESYPGDEVIKGVKCAAKATITHFESIEVLKEPKTLEAFRRHGLIE